MPFAGGGNLRHGRDGDVSGLKPGPGGRGHVTMPDTGDG